MFENAVASPLNPDENERLAIEVRNKNEQAKEQLIRGNIPLVFYKVKQWIRLYPHLAPFIEDLTGEGLVALVIAIDRISKREEPQNSNVTGYLSVSIAQRIGRYVAKERQKPLLMPSWFFNKIQVPDHTDFIDFIPAAP